MGSPGSIPPSLGSGAAADLMKLKLSPLKPGEDFAKSVAAVSGLLVLECSGGSVRKAAAFAVEGTAQTPAFHARPGCLDAPPLT